MKNTIQALKEYDATQGKREAAWLAAETDFDVTRCIAADERALLHVRRAFLKDTQNVNTWSQVKVATLDFMRECAERYEKGIAGGPMRFR